MGELVEQFLNKPLRLWVYNHEYNVTRLVTIEPSRSWGGTGALGCILGFGALHRIPAPLDEPPQAPGETLFETARLSSEQQQVGYPGAQSYDLPQHSSAPEDTSHFLVPADLPIPPPPTGSTISPPPTGAAARKARPRPRAAPSGMNMDDYFAEGEAKSKEEDYSLSSKSTSAALPPPPKAGGPPRAASTAEQGEGPNPNANEIFAETANAVSAEAEPAGAREDATENSS